MAGILPGPAVPAVPPGPATFASLQDWQQYLVDQAVARWQVDLGTTHQGPYYPYLYAYRFGAVTLAANVDAAGQTYSTTNVQVAGVDEADLVKTDGSYIYVLSGDMLDIVKAWPATGLDIVSHTTLEGQPIGLYLSNGRLTVISNVFEPYDNQNPTPVGAEPPIMMGQAQVMALPVGRAVGVGLAIDFNPGWTNAYSSYRSMLKVTVFDLTNPSDPEVVQESYVDGAYVDSRAIGDQVYLVTENAMPSMPMPLVHQDGTSYTYETEADYRERLMALPADQFLPQKFSKDAQRHLVDTGPQTLANHIYEPAGPGANEFVSVMVFDVMSDKPGPVDSVAVLSNNPTTVYANLDHLYLVSNPSGYWGTPDVSVIQKFILSGDSVSLAATGSAPGQITQWPNGQFSLDEQNGYLRIATSDFVYGSNATSNIYVLGQFGNDLDIVGSLENIAPGEQIFAVQFMGDRGFVVTFHSFDPLFTVDLSDPTNPQIIGQLAVPGVSRYIQAIDPNHIVGFGLDVTGGEGSDLELSLYDVSNLAQPVLVDHYVITTGLWAVYSDVFDHHAFGYYPEYQTLAIPTLTALWGSGESSLFVFQVHPDSGFELTGQIQQDGVVERSLRIDNLLYSISTEEITVHPIGDPTTTVGQISLPSDGSGWSGGGGLVGWGMGVGAAWWSPPHFVNPPHKGAGVPDPGGNHNETSGEVSGLIAAPPPSHTLIIGFDIAASSPAQTYGAATIFAATTAKQNQVPNPSLNPDTQFQIQTEETNSRSEGFVGSNDSVGSDALVPSVDNDLGADPTKLDFATPSNEDLISRSDRSVSEAEEPAFQSFQSVWESDSSPEISQVGAPDQNWIWEDQVHSDPIRNSNLVGEEAKEIIPDAPTSAQPTESFWLGAASALFLLWGWPKSINRPREATEWVPSGYSFTKPESPRR